jgi:hypothetical protein
MEKASVKHLTPGWLVDKMKHSFQFSGNENSIANKSNKKIEGSVLNYSVKKMQDNK